MEEDICIPPHLTYRRPDFDFPKNHLRSVSRERNIPTAFVPTEKKKKRQIVFTLSSGNGSQMSQFFFFSCS